MKFLNDGLKEVRGDIKDVRGEMHQGFNDVREEMHKSFDELKTLFFQEKIKELQGKSNDTGEKGDTQNYLLKHNYFDLIQL